MGEINLVLKPKAPLKKKTHVRMLTFIDNLYYRFYRFITNLGEESIPRYNAVLLLSILSILNFITVVVLVMIVTRKIIIVNLPKGYLFIIGLLIVALNSYRVFGNNRYKNIEDRFKNESKGARTRNNLLAVTYIVLTILLFVVSLVYLNSNPIIKNNKI